MLRIMLVGIPTDRLVELGGVETFHTLEKFGHRGMGAVERRSFFRERAALARRMVSGVEPFDYLIAFFVGEPGKGSLDVTAGAFLPEGNVAEEILHRPFAGHAGLFHARVGNSVDHFQEVSPTVVNPLQELVNVCRRLMRILCRAHRCSFAEWGTPVDDNRSVVEHDKRRQRHAQTRRRIVTLTG